MRRTEHKVAPMPERRKEVVGRIGVDNVGLGMVAFYSDLPCFVLLCVHSQRDPERETACERDDRAGDPADS